MCVIMDISQVHHSFVQVNQLRVCTGPTENVFVEAGGFALWEACLHNASGPGLGSPLVRLVQVDKLLVLV